MTIVLKAMILLCPSLIYCCALHCSHFIGASQTVLSLIWLVSAPFNIPTFQHWQVNPSLFPRCSDSAQVLNQSALWYFSTRSFSSFIGGRGPTHAPQCFWCCQKCFNISKGRHFDEAEGIWVFINGSQAINAPMPSLWIIYRFAFFFFCSPVAHLLFDAPWALGVWRKHLNGLRMQPR